MQVMDSGNGLTKPANIHPELLFINDLHLYIEQCDSDYYADL